MTIGIQELSGVSRISHEEMAVQAQYPSNVLVPEFRNRSFISSLLFDIRCDGRGGHCDIILGGPVGSAAAGSDRIWVLLEISSDCSLGCPESQQR